MKIKEQKIPVQRTGVFYEAGNPDQSDVVWFTCHGYGQLSENMIKKFDVVVDRGHSVICVEGMNRFYWQGVSGQPVATWMTKRFRFDEIRDNNNYLSDIYQRVGPGKKQILLGFSQGGTTMWRWIHEKRPDFDIFINYAGWMPEDIDLSVLSEYLEDKKLIFVHGNQDEYLTENRIEAFNEVLSRSTLDVEFYSFDGTHKIERNVLSHMVKKFDL